MNEEEGKQTTQIQVPAAAGLLANASMRCLLQALLVAVLVMFFGMLGGLYAGVELSYVFMLTLVASFAAGHFHEYLIRLPKGQRGS